MLEWSQIINLVVLAAGFGGTIATVKLSASNNAKDIAATNKKVDDLSIEVRGRIDHVENDQKNQWSSHNKLKERVAGAEARCSVTHARGVV